MNIFSIKAAAATLFTLMLWCTSANATLITYKLSAGPITNAGMGVGLGDTVTALIQVDNTLEDAAALVSFEMDVAGQNWTEAHVDNVFDISFFDEELVNVLITFVIPGFAEMTWATNNTWNIFEENSPYDYTYCNSCVSFEQVTVPEPVTIVLLIIGLLGIRSTQRIIRK